MDAGLLLTRSVFGLLLVIHGGQKLFGWFGGSGLRGTGAFFESLGFHPGLPFVIAAALGEIGGGALLTLGFFQPAAAAAIVSVMLVAIVTVHWGHGLLAPAGIELPLLYLAVAVSLALTGPGIYSLDAMTGLNLWWTPQVAAVALAAGAIGGVASLGARRRQPATARASAVR